MIPLGFRKRRRRRPCRPDRRLTIHMMRALAASKGGRCLSLQYEPHPAKLEWECAKGHRWRARPNDIRNNGSWCPRCAGQIVLIEDMQELARRFGGQCLSPTFRGSLTKLRWRCSKGHEFLKQPAYVREGAFCPECSPRRRVTLGDLRAVARERGGRCRATRYHPTAKLEWECARGHSWLATATSVRHGVWCRRCAYEAGRHTLETVRLVAFRRGGACLSDRYDDTRRPMRWQCARGHEWSADFGSIAAGKWCPHSPCNFSREGSLFLLRQIALFHGGASFAEDQFVSRERPIKWRCTRGHQWRARPRDVIRGEWCPSCPRAFDAAHPRFRNRPRSR